MHDHSSTDIQSANGRADKGFTLVEILIAIVLVGILSAVVVVGISNLTSKGSTSACTASLDAAKAGSVVYFTSQGSYPATMLAMTVDGTTPAAPPALSLPSGVLLNTVTVGTSPVIAIGNQAKSGTNWTLTMTPGATGVSPTFVCS